jgi:hypothetical protein
MRLRGVVAGIMNCDSKFVGALLWRRVCHVTHNKLMRQRSRTSPYKSRRRSHSLPYHRRDVLLSRGEAAFFHALLRAASSQYVIALKVRAADLISCSRLNWDDGFGHMIARQHLDFVLCDRRTTRIIAAVELDDRSHSAPERRKRDEFLDQAFAAAGLPLIRFRAAAEYCPNAISLAIRQALANAA